MKLRDGYTLVTHNTKEFSRVPGLRLEDWLVYSPRHIRIPQ